MSESNVIGLTQVGPKCSDIQIKFCFSGVYMLSWTEREELKKVFLNNTAQIVSMANDKGCYTDIRLFLQKELESGETIKTR